MLYGDCFAIILTKIVLTETYIIHAVVPFMRIISYNTHLHTSVTKTFQKFKRLLKYSQSILINFLFSCMYLRDCLLVFLNISQNEINILRKLLTIFLVRQ